MSLTQWITEGLHQYAYQPEMVYLLVVVIMVLSSFGLPVPEEVVIITTSMLAYMSLNPDLYPPPEPGSRGVNVYILMTVCFLAVFISDLIVFQIGRHLGRNVTERKWFQRIIKPPVFRRVKFWTQKYGSAAAGIFRFLPGLRFPGHMACGILGIPTWKFIAVDFIVIFITIPAQVFLIATYGEEILNFMHKFSSVLIAAAVLAVLYIIYTVYVKLQYLKKKNALRAERRKAFSEQKNHDNLML